MHNINSYLDLVQIKIHDKYHVFKLILSTKLALCKNEENGLGNAENNFKFEDQITNSGNGRPVYPEHNFTYAF